MRQSRILQIQALRGLRLQPHAIVIHSQQLGNVLSNLRRVRTNLRRSQNQTGIQIRYAITRVPHPLQRLAQKNHRVRAFPLRIRRRKQSPNIRSRNRTQQRIRNGMQQNVAIRMPAQPAIMRQRNSADPQRNPCPKFMRVKPIANANPWFRGGRARGFTFRVSSFRFQVV